MSVIAVTALSGDAAGMATLLVLLTQPDTEAIRQAELALKPILKDPRCVPALVEILKARDSQVSWWMMSRPGSKSAWGARHYANIFHRFEQLVLTCAPRLVLAGTRASCGRYLAAKEASGALWKVRCGNQDGSQGRNSCSLGP